MTLAAAAAAAKPFIDWASLGKVAGVAFIFGFAIIAMFSIGILALSWARPEPGASPGQGDLGPGGVATASPALGYAVSSVCFAFCAAAVLFGLWLIIPQFHK